MLTKTLAKEVQATKKAQLIITIMWQMVSTALEISKLVH